MAKVMIDMDMPKSCMKCPFFVFNGKDKFNLCIAGKFSMAMYRGKHESCPLQEVKE